MTFLDKMKQRVWRVIYRVFPMMQRVLLNLHIVWHKKGRQPYHVGWLSLGKTLPELKKHLHLHWDFGNHFVAWIDDGQVLSWRKLVDFRHQYHVRVFADGEIRGHFEFTPEAHPIKHFIEEGEKECKEEFLRFLGEFVTTQQTISHLKVDPHAHVIESQITIENVGVYKNLVRY